MIIKKFLQRQFYKKLANFVLTCLDLLKNIFKIYEFLKKIDLYNKNQFSEVLSKHSSLSTLISKNSSDFEKFSENNQHIIEEQFNLVKQQFFSINNELYELQKKSDCFQKILQKQEKTVIKIQEQIQMINADYSTTEENITSHFDNLLQNVDNQIKEIVTPLKTSLIDIQTFMEENYTFLEIIKREVQEKVLILIDWPNICLTASRNIDKNFKYIINPTVFYNYLKSYYKSFTLEAYIFIPEKWNNDHDELLKIGRASCRERV